MSFVEPQLFGIMILPLAFFTYVVYQSKEKLLTIFDKEILERLSLDEDTLSLKARHFFILGGLFFMLIALARPVIDHGDRIVKLEGLSALVALDISGSMRAKDVYPNRLEFAKKKIVTLLHSMPYDELSLLAFAHATFMLAPFSSDKITLEQIIEGVNDKYINMSSTDFTALANFSKKVLTKKKEKILILFSDGGEREALKKFSRILKEAKISLYVVLIGSKEGTAVIAEDGKALIYQNKPVFTQRNDELGVIAMENKGAYVIAHTGKSDIQNLLKKIKKRHQSDKKGEIHIHDRVELFYFPLGLGLLFLLIAFSSLPRRES